ncbi:MAG TPA: RNA polymerase sigma factor [Ruminiclostridium sp.]|nr:RNA polymerase sigma factor [Ruminiclostridium sp.]
MSDNAEINHLLIRISEGDKNALEELWTAMKDGLYSFILSYIRDKQLAEDALQETFIAIYKSAGKFKKGTNARAWIFTIARYSAISLLRKQKEEVYELDETADISDGSDFERRTEQKDELDRLLDSLDEASRRILLMHAVNDLKHIEIAKILSLPVGTVYRKYSQGIKKLNRLYFTPNIEEVRSWIKMKS